MNKSEKLHLDAATRDQAGLVDVLDRLVDGTRTVLGENYVGTYLQGSLATGGFDNHSDIDFFVVTEDQPIASHVDALQEFHCELYQHPCYWAQHLEGSYAPRTALQQLPPPRVELLYLNHGATTFEVSDHDHYLAVLWILRERGIALDGPPAKALVPPVPVDALRAEVRKTMVEWGSLMLTDSDEISARWYQAFAVLSYCRMAETLESGEIHSKLHGAGWAKATMGEQWQSLIDEAIAERARPIEELLLPPEPATKLETQSFVRQVLKNYIR